MFWQRSLHTLNDEGGGDSPSQGWWAPPSCTLLQRWDPWILFWWPGVAASWRASCCPPARSWDTWRVEQLCTLQREPWRRRKMTFKYQCYDWPWFRSHWSDTIGKASTGFKLLKLHKNAPAKRAGCKCSYPGVRKSCPGLWRDRGSSSKRSSSPSVVLR